MCWQLAEVIQEFEDTAYAGIAEEHRPPTFWTTHTHTGRLELNYCMPRAILAGDGRLRSINPHPPGRESIKLFDAFRDVFNARYGWADPEDPSRSRLTKAPNWVQKVAAEAARAGKGGKKSLVAQLGAWVEAGFASGEITSRNDLITQLQAGGVVVIRLYEPKQKPAPTPGDTMKAVAEWESANETIRSIFLEQSRGLDPDTLASDRFAGTFRVDERQNAVFPYRNGDGSIVGRERRNRPPPKSKDSFKHYAGMVGIWTSNASPSDTRLVITESPIDAMSHWEMLSPDSQAETRYAVIRSGARDEDLEAIIRAMPEGSEIISACDPNKAGDDYTTKIMTIAASCGRDCRDERPEKGDWNAGHQRRIDGGVHRHRDAGIAGRPVVLAAGAMVEIEHGGSLRTGWGRRKRCRAAP